MDETQDKLCLLHNRHLKFLLGLAIFMIIIISSSHVTVDKHYESNPAPVWAPAITADIIRGIDDYDAEMSHPTQPANSITSDRRMFNSSGLDTLVFVHIQKTGGSTMEQRLVEDIVNDRLYKCPRPLINTGTWIFSRFSSGWACGVHADWTELNDCVASTMDEQYGVKERNLMYITNIRSPILRFLSEWQHVQRGATWATSTLRCAHRNHTFLTSQCYTTTEKNNWINVTLDTFLDCDQNLAFNRQTRMLADLNLVGCYQNIINNTHDLDRLMLESAKVNLSRMPWFGLLEYQSASQYLFEAAFKPLHFTVPFAKTRQIGERELKLIDPDVLAKVKRRNYLDIELYAYARDIFFQRLYVTKKSVDEGL